jgi:hypothetical protein
MSQRQPGNQVSIERRPDLFTMSESTAITQVGMEQVAAYVAALEARCNTLWGYIQGYDCSCDPVVRFLASELGITVAHAGEMESRPAAD